MIERVYIKTVADEELDKVFKSVPGVLKEIRNPRIYDKWIGLATDRALMLSHEGYIRGKYGLDDFIKKAVFAYAENVLIKIGKLKAPEGFDEEKLVGFN